MTVTEGLRNYPVKQETWYGGLEAQVKVKFKGRLAPCLPALGGPPCKRKLPEPWHVQLARDELRGPALSPGA